MPLTARPANNRFTEILIMKEIVKKSLRCSQSCSSLRTNYSEVQPEPLFEFKGALPLIKRPFSTDTGLLRVNGRFADQGKLGTF